jgi:hypothetical protein
MQQSLQENGSLDSSNDAVLRVGAFSNRSFSYIRTLIFPKSKTVTMRPYPTTCI